MNRQGLYAVAAVIALSGLFPLSLWAGDQSMGRGGRPPGPPPEAVAACKGKTEGTAVEFTLRDGKTVKGICRTFNGQMAAAPDNMPPPPGSGSSSGTSGSSN